MRRSSAIVVLFACLTIAKPSAQTRESPLTGRDLPRRPKSTRFVPPVVTADDLGGQPGLVMLELLIAPSGDVAEARMRSGPASIMAAAIAAAKQWKYEPMIVNGKGVWFRIDTSIQITPTNGAPGVTATGAGTSTPAKVSGSGSDIVKDAPTPSVPLEAVHVSTGLARDSGSPVTLVTSERGGRLVAFLIAHKAGSRPTISFKGLARVIPRPGEQLAILPATGRGWLFLPPNATWPLTDVATRPADVRIAGITRVPAGTARSHEELAASLMRAR